MAHQLPAGVCRPWQYVQLSDRCVCAIRSTKCAHGHTHARALTHLYKLLLFVYLFFAYYIYLLLLLFVYLLFAYYFPA